MNRAEGGYITGSNYTFPGLSDLMDMKVNYIGASGSPYPNSFGAPTYSELNISDDAMDKLIGRMMVHTQKVIIPCRYCGSHNAFSNPSCIKCGAPMGELNHA